MHGERTETPQALKPKKKPRQEQPVQNPTICGCRKSGVKPRVVVNQPVLQSNAVKSAISESDEKPRSSATHVISKVPQLVEGASLHVAHGEFRFVVPFMVNGDRIFARKFVTVDDALSFVNSDSAIAAWRLAHPDDDSLIGKIIECY